MTVSAACQEDSLQGLYLLLITNKGSNILEDLDTLRLLSKTVPEYVHPVDEEGVSAGAFELIFAFDEVISMGHRESITVAQVIWLFCHFYTRPCQVLFVSLGSNFKFNEVVCT